MTATAPGSGWLPDAPLPGGRDREGQSAREARRQAARRHDAEHRSGLGPTPPPAWLEPEEEPIDITTDGRGRRSSRTQRVAVMAVAAALGLTLVLHGLVEAAEPQLTTRPASDEIVRVLADDAGHRFDRGHVREVEVDVHGDLWVAVGRRVLALGAAGAVRPQAQGWQAFPRRISASVDGTLWATEDGGNVVRMTSDGWATTVLSPPAGTEHRDLDADALVSLRAAGDVHTPRVLASVDGVDGRRWVLLDVTEHADSRPAEHRLLRFDGESWTVLGPDEGMPRDELLAWTVTAPHVSPALTMDDLGRAWFSLPYGGLWLADDNAVRRVHFPGLGSGALDLARTPDGVIWIASARGQLFRWDPGTHPVP